MGKRQSPQISAILRKTSNKIARPNVKILARKIPYLPPTLSDPAALRLRADGPTKPGGGEERTALRQLPDGVRTNGVVAEVPRFLRENVQGNAACVVFVALLHQQNTKNVCPDPVRKPVSSGCGRLAQRLVREDFGRRHSTIYGESYAYSMFIPFSVCACHPCAGAMLIFSASSKFNG